jgi:hypothetical protein
MNSTMAKESAAGKGIRGPFRVVQRGRSVEIWPRRGRMLGYLAEAVFVIAFFVGVAVWEYRDTAGPAGVEWLAALPIGFCVVLGLWFWLRWTIPLVIEKSGRVSFASRELCGPGSARRLRIITTDPTEPSFEIVIDRIDGESVELPAPYFTSFWSRESARDLATHVALALAAPLIDDD